MVGYLLSSEYWDPHTNSRPKYEQQFCISDLKTQEKKCVYFYVDK